MRLTVSFSPHTLSRHTLGSYHLTWLACALPAALAGVILYGFRAVLILALTTITAVIAEELSFRVLGRDHDLRDGHAALVGFLFGLTLSPVTPFWVAIIGAVVAVVLGKMLFGGLGYYPFNPVLVGWVVCYMSFPDLMATYIEPAPGTAWPAAEEALTPIMAFQADPSELYTWSAGQLFMGGYAGPIGASSALALIIGGLVLLARGYLKPHITIGFLAGLVIMSLIYSGIDPDLYAPWWWQILVGQALLAAIFLAPEPTTSPVTPWGMLLFGLGAGLTCFFIRTYGSHPDGALYGVLFFNALTPILDRIKSAPFGRVKDA